MYNFFRCCSITASAVTLACALTLPAFANLNVRSAILMDTGTGKILYAQNADRKIAPASLTKIMTMYVAMDAVKLGKVKLKDKVKISTKAAKVGGSRMHIRAGEYVTLDKLLQGVAISSGNDASMAVAEHVAGSEHAFVKLMNAKAKKLGMKGTVFVNPHGLPAKGQVTTARDMLALSRDYLKTHPRAMSYHRMKTLAHRGVTTYNKNPLLKDCPGADGLKSGWIRASGYNLVSTVKRGDTRLVGVVLGSSTAKVRAKEMRSLVEAGFTALNSKGKKNVGQVLAARTPKPAAQTKTASTSKKKAPGGSSAS